ncbi:alpha/beta hydrolase [Actinoplanes sp. TBRC 11911]|nr:alpha/beta hydrolase [Actinoplanes sp. TBRC 11911]
MDRPLSAGQHTIEIDGVTQRYHVFGSGPVCIVHPGGPGFDWGYLRMPTVERSLTTVYVEPIGTGGSGRLATHPDGYTREHYTRALDGLIDHLGVDRPHLLGHSHGGFVAQYYAYTRDRLAGVTLYESAASVGPEHFAEANRNLQAFAKQHADDPRLADVVEAWQSVPAIADDNGFTTAAQRLFPVYFADYWDREREFAEARTAVHGSYISGLDDCHAPQTIDDRSALASITIPTLVVVGRHDFICGPRAADELHAGIPGSRLVVLEKSGHFGHLEQPDEFARAVTDFVTSTP